MVIDLETLLAYVDGELPPQFREEIEAAIASSPELGASVNALVASRLPYQRAFERHATAPVPDKLRIQVEALVAEAAPAREPALALAVGGNGFKGAPSEQSLLGGGRALGLALLVLLSIVAVLQLTSHFGSSGSSPVEPWVMRVGAYQAMYSRETIADVSSGLAQTRTLQQRLEHQGMDLRIPDLSSQGLQFVRAQQLQFGGKIVLQLVYLPQSGGPVALCVTPADVQPEHLAMVEGLQAMTWHADGWAYVLIGDLSVPRIKELRQQIPSILT